MTDEFTPDGPENGSPSEAPQPPQRSRAAYWQFLRRAILLLVAYGLALPLIRGTRALLPLPSEAGLSRADIVSERLPASLALLGTAVPLSLLIAFFLAGIALALQRIETHNTAVGAILGGLGKLIAFADTTLPVFALNLVLIYVFALQLGIFPAAGSGAVGQALVLPAVALALFPALTTAQAVTRAVARWESARPWLLGLFMGIGTLFGQTGGLLGGLILVETVSARPGVGRLAFESILRRDLPVLLAAVTTLATVILVGRLAAELFRWLARLVTAGQRLAVRSPVAVQRPRRAWVWIGLVLLLVPLGLGAAGLTISADEVQISNLADRNAGPSEAHPWGADELGRDIQARVLRGATISVGVALGVTVVLLVLGAPYIVVVGALVAHGQLWSESVADLLLLPADVFLFVPALLGALLLVLIGPGAGTAGAVVGIGVALVPRAARAVQALWLYRPRQGGRGKAIVAGLGGAFLGIFFMAFWLVTAVDFMGLGVQPPAPTLGRLLSGASQFMRVNPAAVFAPAIILWACAFALYTAADACLNFFNTKTVMARLNE